MGKFIGLTIGDTRLGLEFGKTDRYTQMLPTQHYDEGLALGYATENWESVSGNELKLFKTTPEVFIIVDKFGRMFSNGQFIVKDSKSGKVLEGHKLLDLLNNPNPLQNRNAWLMDISTNFHLYGASFNLMNKGSRLSDYPSTITPLPNSDLKTKLTGKLYRATELNEIISGYESISTLEKFATEEVFYIRRGDPEDPRKSFSILNALQMPITNIRGAYGFRNTNIYKKGGVTVVSPKDKGDQFGSAVLTDPDKKELEKAFQKEYGWGDKRSGVKITGKPIEVNHLSYPIKDSMLFEEISENMMKLIDAVGLNRYIFSTKEGSKYKDMGEGLKMAYQDGIIPFSELVCYAIEDALNLREMNISLEMSFAHLAVFQMSADEYNKRIEAVAKLIELGFTREQAMEMAGVSK